MGWYIWPTWKHIKYMGSDYVNALFILPVMKNNPEHIHVDECIQ